MFAKDIAEQKKTVSLTTAYERISTTFDFDQFTARAWMSAIAEASLQLGHNMNAYRVSMRKLRENTDGGSCGLLCCQALELYLGNFPAGHTSIRAHYLRRYQLAYCLSNRSSELNGPRNFTITGELPESADSQMKNQDSFDTEFTDPVPFLPVSMENIHGLGYARQKRLLPLIMQCSTEHFHRFISSHTAQILDDQISPVRTRTPSEAILGLYEELHQTPRDFLLPSLMYQLRLVEIFISLSKQITDMDRRMEREQQARNNESANHKMKGAVEPRQPRRSGTSAENRVLQELYSHHLTTTRTSKRYFKNQRRSFRGRGGIMYELISKLGIGILLALPSTTVHLVHIRLRSDTLGTSDKVIEPSE
jgi:hypothetical protein